MWCDHWGRNKLQYSWNYVNSRKLPEGFSMDMCIYTRTFILPHRLRMNELPDIEHYTKSTQCRLCPVLLAPCWSDDIQGVNCESGGLIKRFIPLSRLTFAYFDMEMRMKCPMHYVNTHKFHFPSSSSTSSYAFFLNGWMSTSTTLPDGCVDYIYTT